MLHAISWSTFFSVIGSSLLFYWSFIAFVYYRQEIKLLLAGKAKPASQTNGLIADSPFEAEEDNPASSNAEAGADLFPVAYALAEEVKALVKDAGRRRLIREELIQALQSLFKRNPYSQLRDTGFRPAINNLVEAEADAHCSMHFSPEDLDVLWLR
jgi:hypothetical protein